jgi:competence protein ComEC
MEILPKFLYSSFSFCGIICLTPRTMFEKPMLSKALPKFSIFLMVFFFMVGLTLVESVADAPSQISFINVGQGDSALIQDDSGFDILIDGGRTSAGPTVVAFLKSQGVDTLEVMVASHADNDHIGGLISVLQDPAITVQTVYTNGYSGDTLTWDYFVDAVATAGAVTEIAQFPQTFTWGNTSIQVLNPVEGLSDPDQTMFPS